MNTKKLKNIFSQLMGHLYVPPEVLESEDLKVLHISDTPTVLYPAIANLLEVLNPDIVVHTGDLADDIKLEDNSNYLVIYQQRVAPIIKVLEECSAKRVYVVPGNHDDVAVIEQHIKKVKLLGEGEIVDTGIGRLGVAHKLSNLPTGVSFNLYGHNFKKPVSPEQGAVYLNGLRNIHVILLPSNKVAAIPYPMGTNHHRKIEDKYMLPNGM